METRSGKYTLNGNHNKLTHYHIKRD